MFADLFRGSLVIISVLAFGSSLTTTQADEAPLNVLLITADDLGTQLNCYGDDTVPTPSLNSLAEQSVLFQTAWVAQASCSSSRSAMLTGTYPHTNGHYGLANAGVGFHCQDKFIQQSIPNVLKRHGFRTGIIGKLHVDPESKFDLDLHTKEGFGNRDVRRQVELAQTFWKDSGEQPWFLMFNVFDPHVRGRRPQGAPAFPDVVKGVPMSPIHAEDVAAWPWQGVDTPVMRRRIAGYYNCVQRVDAAVGMILESLAQIGQQDKTLVIFLGDHGPPFSRGKTTCYNAGLRVPFLLRWPGVSEPHVSEQFVSAVDIAPTIFDAAGLPIPDFVQGMSLRPVAGTSSSAGWRDVLAAEFHFHGAGGFYPTRAVTDGRFKLIHRLPGRAGRPVVSVDGDPSSRELAEQSKDHPSHEAYSRLHQPPEWEFYDLTRDPHEFQNLTGETAYAEAEQRLKDALRNWQEATDDPFRDESFSAEVAQKYLRQ